MLFYKRPVNTTFVYNTRTLLDTSSSVNWIAPNVLKYVEHQSICCKQLEMNYFYKIEKLKYKLVEIKR